MSKLVSFGMLMRKDLGLLVGCALLSVLAMGCNSGENDSAQANQEREEIARLQQENEALAQVRTENEEVQSLKKANQELPKLRSQYQEMLRLQKENSQLAQQVAKLQPRGDAAQAAAAAAGSGQGSPTAASALLEKKDKAADEATLHEGDEILIDPKHLKQLLPDFDWDKLGRKEPVAVRSLLEQDGTILTNISQLKELGLTNFVIQRAPPPPPSPDQPPPQP